MNDDRYGGTGTPAKVLGTIVALGMIVLGAIWTFSGAGAATTLGPILAGLGVALAYVVLWQNRRRR